MNSPNRPIGPFRSRLGGLALSAMFCGVALIASPATAAEPEPDPAAQAAAMIAAAGGVDRLPRLFRVTEQLNVSADAAAKGKQRVSVMEPPKFWWLGTRERVSQDKEPATFLVWAWSLGILADPASKLETLPELKDDAGVLTGIRVSGTVSPAMDLYFDANKRLVRIDWRDDLVRFSEFKTFDGFTLATKTVGYRKKTGKAWYFTEITKFERLETLPNELSREPKPAATKPATTKPVAK